MIDHFDPSTDRGRGRREEGDMCPTDSYKLI